MKNTLLSPFEVLEYPSVSVYSLPPCDRFATDWKVIAGMWREPASTGSSKFNVIVPLLKSIAKLSNVGLVLSG